MKHPDNNENRGQEQPDIDPVVLHELARLLADPSMESRGDNLPPPWSGIVSRLAHRPIEERVTALQDELKAVPGIDPDWLMQRIFEVDPQSNSATMTSPTPFPFPPPIEVEERETESEGLAVVPLGELMRRPNLKIEWAVGQLIPAGTVAILAGPAGHGKSWALLDLAVETARGGRWLGEFPTRKGRVLYLDEESSPALLQTRLKKLFAAKGIPGTDLEIHFGIGLGLSFSDGRSVNQLRQSLATLRPDLVIIDSLIRVHRAEENSATDMARVFGGVKDLVREYGCTIVFADHQRKSFQPGASPDQLLRGSTEKSAFVDTLLSMQRRHGQITVEHAKCRYAEPVQPFLVRIEDTAPGATVVRYGGNAAEAQRAARQEVIREFLLERIPLNQWVSRQDLISQGGEVEIGSKSIGEVLKQLTEQGVVKREDRKLTEGRGGKQAFYIRTASPITSPSPSYIRGETETETETSSDEQFGLLPPDTEEAA